MDYIMDLSEALNFSTQNAIHQFDVAKSRRFDNKKDWEDFAKQAVTYCEMTIRDAKKLRQHIELWRVF